MPSGGTGGRPPGWYFTKGRAYRPRPASGIQLHALADIPGEALHFAGRTDRVPRHATPLHLAPQRNSAAVPHDAPHRPDSQPEHAADHRDSSLSPTTFPAIA